MTVSNTTVTTSSNGTGTNGSDGAFSFAIGNIKFSDNSDLDVYIRDVGESPPTEALKTITTHYFITDSAGNQVNPGTHIRFDTSAGHSRPLNDQKVVVKRKVELTQSTDYASGDAFPADSHEDALDKLTLLVQQMQEQLDRAWTYPETYSTLANVKMPEPANDGIIKYNADATALVLDTDLVNSTYKLYASNTSDTTAGFLNDKLSAGTGLSKSNTSGVENQSVTLSINLKDEDNMASDSASHAASQQSIKAYVDAVTTSLAAQDLDFTTDTVGNSAVDLDTQVMTFAGGEGVDVTHSGQTITVAGEDASTSNKGVASFNSDSFSVSSGAVSLKEGAVLDNPVIKGDGDASGSIVFQEDTDNGSHTATVKCPEALGDNRIVTLPDATTTLVGTDTTDTLTNKTLTSPKMNEDVAMTTTSTYLNRMDATSSVQTQLNAKQASITSSARLDADLIHDGSVSNTEFGHISTLSSNAQTQLDAKAPISQPEFTSYVDFDSISAPSAPSDSGDVRVYANNSKLYFHGQGGSATEIGAGGGVGSIDTLFTIQAKSADAAYTAIGNGYVWSGAGSSLTNATLALETTALDLIQSEKVFAYDSGGSGIRNWWYHEQEIQNGYGGKNMVLQLQYFTRNCADSNIFRFYARDAAKPIFTSDGSADAGTNQILGAASWDASLSTSSPDDRKAAEVGDRIVIIDTSNNIHYRYITAVSGVVDSPGALTITYSGADIAPANSTVMLIGVMTDELDYLPANNMSAAGNNEAKLYKKQMSFPEGCRLFQFGFHVESTDADVELYYDDIALSANQFLQTSSRGQTESYYTTSFGSFWQSTGSTSLFNTTNIVPSGGSPTLANSNLVTISDVSSKTRITAKQKIKLDINLTGNMSASYSSEIYNSDDQAIAMEFSGSARWDNLGASIVLEKNDYIYLKSHNVSSEGGINFTATPQVNDVVLLNSQDEIFTDWVSYTPSWFNSPTVTNQQVFWRRNGPSLEIKGRMQLGSNPASTMGFSLPSGLSIDISKIGGEGAHDVYLPSRFIRVTSTVKYNNADSNSCGLFFDKSQATKTTNLFVGTNHNAQSGDCIDSVDYNNFGSSGDGIEFYAHGIPIAGWSSTFNPVLSMPLVDLGSDKEKGQWDTHAGYGSTNTKTQYYTNEVVNEISSLGTVVNNSTTGWSFTASQNVRVTAMQVISSSAGGAYFGWSLNASDATASIESLTYANGKLLVEGNQSANGLVTIPITTLMKAGDVLRPQGGGSTIDNLQSYQSMNIVVEKDHSHTNMAHIIKPAVCVIEEQLAQNTSGGANSGGNYVARKCNVWSGETWFVSGATGSLGVGGTNAQFDLEAGTYEVEGFACTHKTDGGFTRFMSTDSAIIIDGPNMYTAASSNGDGQGAFQGTFTITSSKTFQVKTYAQTTNSSEGLGVQVNATGRPEKYMSCKIRKLK